MREFTIKKSLKTKNYSMFRTLTGNRGVSQDRINKLRKSINDVGYLPSRIIVNENFEVIDGQCRLQVFKEKGLPLYVDVVEGIGIEECIAMNINQKNWVFIDYVQSFADQGVVDYKYLSILIKKYKKLGIGAVVSAVAKTVYDSHKLDKIKKGMFKCTEAQYIAADRKLEFLSQFTDIVHPIGGRTEYIYYSIMFAYDLPNVNKDRLARKILEKRAEFYPVANILQAIELIDKIYNSAIRKNQKVYIRHEYERMKEEK